MDEVAAVLQYDLTEQTQGLALFANGEGGIYQRIELPFRLINRVVLEPSPYVRPVVHALSLLEPFIVARVSRDESSLYLVDEWGAWPRRATSPAPGSAPATGRRANCPSRSTSRPPGRTPWWNSTTRRWPAPWPSGWKARRCRRVVLCAQHDIASNFRRALAPAVAPKVVAEIPFDAADSVDQMLVAARTAANEARQRELAQLMGRIKEGLGGNGHGAAGFDEVMDCLSAARSRRWSWSATTGRRAGRCPDCDWAGVDPVDECPLCGGTPVPIADAVGELVRMAILQSSQVEVAEEHACPGLRWAASRRCCGSRSSAGARGASGRGRRAASRRPSLLSGASPTRRRAASGAARVSRRAGTRAAP